MVPPAAVAVLSLLLLLVLSAVILHALQPPLATPKPSNASTPVISRQSPSPSLSSSFSLPPLSSYELVWSDEFDGEDGSAPSAESWNLETGCGLYNGELQCYTQDAHNAFIQDGQLVIAALRELTEEVTDTQTTVTTRSRTATRRPSASGREQDDERQTAVRQETSSSRQVKQWNYTSARLTTQHKREFLFPRIQARMRLPASRGTWPALWLLGSSISSTAPWPACGEIDIVEAVNTEGIVHSTLHFNQHGSQAANVSHAQLSAAYMPREADGLRGQRRSGAEREDTATGGVLDSEYHLYELLHDPSRLLFALDGEVYYSVALEGRRALDAFGAEQRQPFFLLLNLAIGGWWPGWDVDDDALPAHLRVDWIRVYQQPNQTST